MRFPYIRQDFNKSFIVVCCLIILSIGALLYRSFWIDNVQHKFRLNFIPGPYAKCEDLIRYSSRSGIKLSQVNQLKSKEFEEAVRNASSKHNDFEGHIGLVLGKYLIMHHLAGQPAAKTICETGFNYGHSSFYFLTASEKSIIHSFDLGGGKHAYAHTMSDYLKKLFPNRFFIHFGDSTKTLPEFIHNNPEFQCDIMFVDGGHSYHVALADIKNFAKTANLEENIMVLDDYPTDWGAKDFGKAWEDAINEGILKEFVRCTFNKLTFGDRGFTIGRVLKKPVEDDVTTKTP